MASQAAWLALCGLWECEEKAESPEELAAEMELRRLLMKLRDESGRVMEEQLLS